MKKLLLLGLIPGAALAAGCFSLDVAAVQAQNGDAFTREEVLSNPQLIEHVIAGTFINFWGGQVQDEPWIVFSVFGEEFTTASTNVGSANFTHTEEPRHAFANVLVGGTNLARDPWSNYYEANAAMTELPRYIKDNNIRIIDPNTDVDNTLRALTFAKWVQGMAHINLGLIFDSAAIINDQVDLSDVPILPLAPYGEVIDSGIKWLEEVIEIADNNNFITPPDNDLWVYNTTMTSAEMSKVAHAFIARGLAYKARTPAARVDSTDWARVKEHALKGITSPFGPRGNPNPLLTYRYRIAATSAPQNIASICRLNGANNGTQFCSGAGEVRVDLRLVGPADSTSSYRNWLESASLPNFKTTQPFIVRTRDARIQAENATAPAIKPVYFKYTNLNPPVANFDTINRGRYYVSHYWNSTRAVDNGTQLPLDGGGRNNVPTSGLPLINSGLNLIQDAMLYPVEMDLLVAEAEFRLGNLQAAADLINKTREPNGELDEVLVTGVQQSTGCVPRLYDGSCGSLFDALMYEKRIETYASGISFFDLRGWGCLLEGTPTQLPPPARQLDLLGKLIYTYGGSPGAIGSAAKPTNCPLLHKP